MVSITVPKQGNYRKWIETFDITTMFLLYFIKVLILVYKFWTFKKKFIFRDPSSQTILRNIILEHCYSKFGLHVGPYQAFLGQTPFPILSASALPWSTYTIVSDAHFLSYFTDVKTPTKWKKLITWWPWAHRPQTYWHLRIDDVNPCHTILIGSH